VNKDYYLCRRLSPKPHGFMICHRLCRRFS